MKLPAVHKLTVLSMPSRGMVVSNAEANPGSAARSRPAITTRLRLPAKGEVIPSSRPSGAMVSDPASAPVQGERLINIIGQRQMAGYLRSIRQIAEGSQNQQILVSEALGIRGR